MQSIAKKHREAAPGAFLCRRYLSLNAGVDFLVIEDQAHDAHELAR